MHIMITNMATMVTTRKVAMPAISPVFGSERIKRVSEWVGE